MIAWFYSLTPLNAQYDCPSVAYRVYPNPTVDRLCIQPIDEATFDQYIIYDMSGHIVNRVRLKGDCIDVSHLVSGEYILWISDSELSNSEYIKFAKQ